MLRRSETGGPPSASTVAIICCPFLALAACGCGEPETTVYAPAAILNDGTTLAVSVPPKGPSTLVLTAPVAWNDTVLIVNGTAVPVTAPIADGATIKSLGGFVFRHAQRIDSKTQATIPMDSFKAASGEHFDVRKNPVRSLDVFYRTARGEYVHWRAPMVVVDGRK